MGRIKTLAQQKGLAVVKGRAYGAYRGFLITLRETPKAKIFSCAAVLDADEKVAELERFVLMQKNQGKKILGYELARKNLWVAFVNHRQDIAQMDEFIELLLSKLIELGAAGFGYCGSCGQPIAADGVMVQVNGNVLQMHGACVAQHNAHVKELQQQIKSEGNLLTGTIGALLGGIVGSIPWAIAYYFGWFVGWLGFLIGLAAKKGYELCHGKTCKAKGVIIILVTVLSVVMAEFAALVVSLVADPEIGMSIGEAVTAVVELTAHNAELRGIVIKETLLGLVFAGLGIFSLAKDIFDDTSAKNDMALPL